MNWYFYFGAFILGIGAGATCRHECRDSVSVSAAAECPASAYVADVAPVGALPLARVVCRCRPPMRLSAPESRP